MGRNIVDWLDVAPLSGYADRILSVTASTLEELDQRAATIKAYNTDYGITATTLFKQVKVSSVVCHSCEMLHDVPASGATVTSADCGNYRIEVFYVDGTSEFISEDSATITGSLVVPSSYTESRHNVGNLPLTITYGGKSTTYNVPVYQAAFVPAVTSITISNITWVTDVPASGGTATPANCTYTVTAYWNNETTTDVTASANVSGSLSVASSDTITRHSVGILVITAGYGGKSDSGSVTAYQAAATPYLSLTPGSITFGPAGGLAYINVNSNVDWDINVSGDTTGATLTGITLSGLTWVTDIPASGGTASYENCTYVVTAYYDDGTSEDVTSLAYMSGWQDIPSSVITTRHSAGTLYVVAAYGDYSDGALVTIFQEAAGSIYDNEYLTLDFTESGNITLIKNSNSSPTVTISYSLNNGAWETLTSDVATLSQKITVSSGDSIRLKGENSAYADGSGYCKFAGLSKFNVSGNILSLIYGDNFIGEKSVYTATTRTFYGLFNGSRVVNAGNLSLPSGISSECFRVMFMNCKYLTTAPASLPSTALTDACYYQMFAGCTGLTSAPQLPASTLAASCYSNMFDGCSNLSYIECFATDISATASHNNWVSGVASSGTFVKPSSMTSWDRGASGIPNNWTITDI